MRRLAIVVLTLSALAFVPVASADVDSPQGYIVVLKPGADPALVAAVHSVRLGLQVGFVYTQALQGYSALVPAGALDALRNDARVAYVERDQTMRAVTTQPGATWGIDRTDQRALPLSGTFTYTATGTGVTAYVIDTGIRKTHAEFGGRAVHGFDAVTAGLSSDDCNGHGTHVSGTIGGATYGIAKGVRLVAVRVLNCAGIGLTSGVIAGVDWVTGNHAPGAPAVANMSLGGGQSAALDQAVRNSIADGVTYAVAAGNDTADACAGSPSGVTQAITVGATDAADGRASFSNFGSCVDWFAPGVNITSAWWLTDTSTNIISGTSMATPHTAGVAALYLQGNPGATAQQVRDALFNLTTKGIVTSAQSANNHLLFTSF
ncbi:MAG TPA: S8 family peptidase [Candidatus Polarisedimenticolia bacterium]|jgi:subtilisin family serine protease|nr:S8 family peptidase [Candidatus Polarisedimenticolia bacterium]